MRVFKLIFTALPAFVIAASAQTTTTQVTTPQVKAPAGLQSNCFYALGIGVICFDPSTLLLDTTQAPPLLRVIPPPATPINRQTQSFTSWTGTANTVTIVTTFIAGTLDVYWNGLLMSSPGDYSTSLSGTATTVTLAVAPSAGDIVTVTYFQ